MKYAKYYIYRNLHKGGFSIKYRGKVIDILDNFTANFCEFKVSESGRQRVINNKQKNVHAYVVCENYETSINLSNRETIDAVTYSPYINNKFMKGNHTIDYSKKCVFSNGKCYTVISRY